MTFSLKRFALIYRVARATPCLVGFHSVPTTRGFFSHPTPAGFLLMGSTPTCPTNPCDSSGSVRLHATSFIRFRYWPVRVNGCCIVRRRSRPCNAADSPFSLSLSLPPSLPFSICQSVSVRLFFFLNIFFCCYHRPRVVVCHLFALHGHCWHPSPRDDVALGFPREKSDPDPVVDKKFVIVH